jgi:hypothetical protein
MSMPTACLRLNLDRSLLLTRNGTVAQSQPIEQIIDVWGHHKALVHLAENGSIFLVLVDVYKLLNKGGRDSRRHLETIVCVSFSELPHARLLPMQRTYIHNDPISKHHLNLATLHDNKRSNLSLWFPVLLLSL